LETCTTEMSNFQLAIIFCLGIIFLKGTHGCATSITGATWEFTWGVDEEIPGIKTVELCSELCKEDNSCRGYTWLVNKVVSFCYKFKNLDGIHACEDCSSGTVPEDLSGACAGSIDDVVDTATTETVEECLQFCHDTLGCNAYTWYNSSTPFANSCFLYASCNEEIPCYGCATGRINCISSPQCFEYQILDEESRSYKNKNIDCSNICLDDLVGSVYNSGRWKGDGYYRFVEPSGTMMPESSPGEYHCGTHGSGWLNGQHPEEVGLEVDMEACFDYSGSSECDSKRDITVTLCNGYFVYHLVDTPRIHSCRYCSKVEN